MLYKSAIQSTVLYGSEIWALRYENKVERAQVRFFKLLYCLPRSTPDYIVRTEFGLDWLLVAIFSRALKWLGKLESMEEHRLPRICYKRQLELVEVAKVEYSWVKQMEVLFTRAGCEEIWTRFKSGEDYLDSDSVVEGLRGGLREEDRRRVCASSFCPNYKEWMENAHDELGTLPVGLKTIRMWHQLRVLNKRCNSLYWNGVVHKFSSEEACKLCSSGSADTLEHFVSECSALQDFRRKFGLLNPARATGFFSLCDMISCGNPTDFSRLMRYLKAVLNARAFAL